MSSTAFVPSFSSSFYDNHLNNVLLFPIISDMLEYLKLIGFEEATTLLETYNSIQSKDVLKIISSIDLQKIAIDKRHYLLCNILCSNNIKNLNYVPNDMLYKVWRTIFYKYVDGTNNNFSINYQLARNGDTLLMMAVAHIDLQCVRELCNKSAYVNLVNKKKYTASDFSELSCLNLECNKKSPKSFLIPDSLPENTLRMFISHCNTINCTNNICNDIYKIHILLRYFSSKMENVYKTAQITIDNTCFPQEKYNYSYSSSSSNSSPTSSSGGGESSPYENGYMGKTADGTCSIYSSFCF